MPTSPFAVRFVLVRLNWRRTTYGLVRLPGEVRIDSFNDPDSAEAERWRLEADARGRVNPFRCGSACHDWTHFDEPILRDWLLDHGVILPNDGEKWADWYDRAHAGWHAQQREAVWSALSRVRFFNVVERPARPTVFALVQTSWWYDDEYYHANGEGGTVIRAYRTREKAEAECARRNREAVEAELARYWVGRPRTASSRSPFDIAAIVEVLADPFSQEALSSKPVFATCGAVPYFTVIELEWGEGK